MIARKQIAIAGALFFAALLSAEPSQAKFYLSGQGGLFSPWDGDPGYSFTIQGTWAALEDSKFRLGGEFEFGKFDTKLLEVPDVEIKAYSGNVILNYRFRPTAAIDPYIGCGGGIAVVSIDKDRIESVRTNIRLVNSVALGANIFGLVGADIRVPATSKLSFFGEARLGYTAMFTRLEGPGSDDLEIENLGGVSVHGGIRLAF